MSQKRSRRLLLAAFVLSLLLHLTAARFVHPSVPPAENPERVTLSHRTPLRIAKAVEPAPHAVPSPHAAPSPLTPLPRRSTSPISVPKLRAAARHAPGARENASSAARQTPLPSVAATAAPQIEITAAPACPNPDAAAAVTSSPPPPELTPAVRAEAISGIAVVNVNLDARGRVTDTQLAQSSGNGALDIVAVQMARSAGYSPKYVSCKAVAGDFTFSVKFFPW